MPLSPTFEKYEVDLEFKSAGANIIVSDEKNLHKFDGVLEDVTNNNPNNVKMVIVFDGKHDKYATYDKLVAEGEGQVLEKVPHFDLNPDKDMLFLIHTSGSSGRPKCAMLPHRMFLNCIQGGSSSNNRKSIDRKSIYRNVHWNDLLTFDQLVFGQLTVKQLIISLLPELKAYPSSPVAVLNKWYR